MKIKSTVLTLIAALALLSPALSFGQGVSGPVSGASYSSYDADFSVPSVSWAATGLTLTYTNGTIVSDHKTTNAIVGATLTLTNTKNTCSMPLSATSACNFVYWTSSTSLSTSTTFATAFAQGNQPLYACGTTGGNITGCLYLPQIAKGTVLSLGGLSVTNCGTAAACSATSLSAPAIVIGAVTFSAATTATITAMPAVFTSSSSYTCTANSNGHAYLVEITYSSATSFVITSGTSNSDAWTYMCIGN